MKGIFFGCLLLLLSGCAVGNKYDYRSSAISLPLKATTHKNVVLSVEDARSYVLDGSKPASFVGLQRGGFGNPFAVTTASGRPLTEDMVVAISRALNMAGFQVFSVAGSSDTELLIEAAAKNGATRIIAFDVKEWKSDIFMSVTLHSDIELKIFDGKGELLAQGDMKFVEGIGGAQIGAAKNSETVASEFSKRIGYLFNRKEIRAALQ